MKEKIIEGFTAVILLVFMALNVFILVRIWQLINIDSIYREKKAEYILPEGFTPAKTKLLWDEQLPAPSGWVVRYASKDCVYCKLDFEWERLVPLSERLNYRTILLPPTENDHFADEQIFPARALQMAYVKMDGIRQFRFSGTPTVVIFDNRGHVLWHRKGMLSDVDYESAEKAVLKNIKG